MPVEIEWNSKNFLITEFWDIRIILIFKLLNFNFKKLKNNYKQNENFKILYIKVILRKIQDY